MLKGKVSFLVIIFAVMILVSSGCSKQNADASSQTSSSQQTIATDLFTQAENFQASNNLLKAKEMYQQIMSKHTDFEKIDVVQQQLGRLNIDLLYSKAMIEGKTVMHEVKSGDTLGKIAKQYGTTVDFIKRSNGLTKDIIRIGERLRIWTAPFTISVDKSQNILVLRTGDEILKVYSVSTGANNITPVGEFKIVTKLQNPTWYKSGAVIAPNSPENGLGTRWMGFDLKGYGIHGTISPESIGHQATAGCVRMLNEQVEELYDIIPQGTMVTVTD